MQEKKKNDERKEWEGLEEWLEAQGRYKTELEEIFGKAGKSGKQKA